MVGADVLRCEKESAAGDGKRRNDPNFFSFSFLYPPPIPFFLSITLCSAILLEKKGETTTTEYYIEIDRGSNPPGRLFIHSPDVCVYTMAVYL